MTASNASPQPPRPAGGFGTSHPRRRKALPASPLTDRELIDAYLAKNSVTRCETRYADGSVQASGSYAW